MKKSENIWFEVFTSSEEDGTETIATFDTLDEAEQYVLDHSEQDLCIDKWQFINGENIRIEI